MPPDISLRGLGDIARVVTSPTNGGTLFAAPPFEPPLGPPFVCVDSIADQATAGCLTASSTPTSGVLFPYPGINNTFVGPAFVGGGEDNQATGPWSAVGNGSLC